MIMHIILASSISSLLYLTHRKSFYVTLIKTNRAEETKLRNPMMYVILLFHKRFVMENNQNFFYLLKLIMAWTQVKLSNNENIVSIFLYNSVCHPHSCIHNIIRNHQLLKKVNRTHTPTNNRRKRDTIYFTVCSINS